MRCKERANKCLLDIGYILNLKKKSFLLDSASSQYICNKGVLISLDEPYQGKIKLGNWMLIGGEKVPLNWNA